MAWKCPWAGPHSANAEYEAHRTWHNQKKMEKMEKMEKRLKTRFQFSVVSTNDDKENE